MFSKESSLDTVWKIVSKGARVVARKGLTEYFI
jgi:hypothetical protein